MICYYLATFIVFSYTKLLVCVDLYAPAGVYFKETLAKKDFFSTNSNDPVMVTYSVAIAGLPDMPKWMKLLHNVNLSSAVIYGTPSASDIGKILLNVVAWNKDSYETVIKEIKLSIITKDSLSTRQQLEFKIKNKDIREMINDCQRFLDTVKKSIWPGATNVVKCESVSDHTNDHIKPIPGQKEGVYLVVGGKNSPPSNVDTLKKTCQIPTSISSTNKDFVDNGYLVDWCALNRIIPSEAIYGLNGFDDATDIFFQPKVHPLESFHDSHQSLSLDVIYLFIPVVLGVVFIVVLTGIFCCKRTRQYNHFKDDDNRSRNLQRTQQQNKSNPPLYQKPPNFQTQDSQM